jgi:threonine/homoserine/homoserine lactone efflux protein
MNITAFLTYVVLTTFTPGPNNIMSLSNANRFGFRNTLNFIFGVAAGFAVIMTLCAFFNLALFKYIPGIKEIIGVLGAIYMLYLAFSIVTENKENETRDGFNSNSFMAGMTLQFINPKVIVYGITAHSVFIIPYFNSNLYLLLFSILLAAAGLISTAIWALCGSLMQQLISNHRQKFNITMAILLVYCAVSVSGLPGIL